MTTTLVLMNQGSFLSVIMIKLFVNLVSVSYKPIEAVPLKVHWLQVNLLNRIRSS